MSRSPRPLGLVLYLLACLLPAQGTAAGRHVAVIVDTSGSMLRSDPGRYTMQLSQVIADLLDPGDSLTVIRLPLAETGCSDGANPRLSQAFEAGDRDGFRRNLNSLLSYGGENYFAAPVRTAAAVLGRHRDGPRLLLFIADSGGLGPCGGMLTTELSALRTEGVMIAAVNLGGPGAFDTNPAFEFTTGATDSEALVNAVAGVYQRFLGGKEIQTGRVQGEIEVVVNPWVREAFLVVAADGPIPGIEMAAGNPAAESIDPDYRGGGHTLGLDGRWRDYRIVHLHRPEAGRWRFRVPGLGERAGWMLLQDSALGLRLKSPPRAGEGIPAALEFELYNRDTGKAVADASPWPGLQGALEMEGRSIPLRDDGKEGDRKAGDGIFTATAVFRRTGDYRIPVRLQSETLDRRSVVEIQVEKLAWVLQPELGARVEAGTPATLSVQLRPAPGAAAPVPLRAVRVASGGKSVANLRDDGRAGDAVAGDGRFSGTWIPEATGDQILEFSPVGEGHALPAQAPVRVVGIVRFASPVPVVLARTGSKGLAPGRLDLGTETLVKGSVSAELTSDFDLTGSVLEIDMGRGWEPLGPGRLALDLRASGPRSWPLRLRVGDCPEGADRSRKFVLLVRAEDLEGRPVETRIPVSVDILEDPWLHCWWPLLAALAGGLLAAVAVHGFWSPSRFSRRLGLVLSPEEDLDEGFFHPVRATPGTRSGFYRDARVYVRQDFRLAGTSRGQIARLRAEGTGVRIRPAPGLRLSRRNLDGEWEDLPAEETTARFGTLYRGPSGTLFFELRNG